MIKALQLFACLPIVIFSCKAHKTVKQSIAIEDSVIDYTDKGSTNAEVLTTVAYYLPVCARFDIASDSLQVTIRGKKYKQIAAIKNTTRQIVIGERRTCELALIVKNPFRIDTFYFVVPEKYLNVQDGLNIRKDTANGIFHIGCYDRAYPQSPKEYFYSLYEVSINEKWESDGVIEINYKPNKITLTKHDLAALKIN